MRVGLPIAGGGAEETNEANLNDWTTTATTTMAKVNKRLLHTGRMDMDTPFSFHFIPCRFNVHCAAHYSPYRCSKIQKRRKKITAFTNRITTVSLSQQYVHAHTHTLWSTPLTSGMSHVNDTWKWFNDVFCSLNCPKEGGREETGRADNGSNDWTNEWMNERKLDYDDDGRIVWVARCGKMRQGETMHRETNTYIHSREKKLGGKTTNSKAAKLRKTTRESERERSGRKKRK